MRRKGRRLVLIGSALGVAGIAAGLVLYALRDSVVFFYAPTEFVAKAPAPGTRLRVGGLVEQGSVKHLGDNRIQFVIGDKSKTITVTYRGLLPDLFREGQGIVAEGVADGSDTFAADSVLAKHDETYMPKDVADALRKRGEWRGQGASAEPAPADKTANR
ncbi:MAG TPA: cytochrome c maturation protein CcmE [Lichenihabitans sp.]|jgi:cytochrome c-type biogenesis protein CcmE|nr:cytochrome c maturation protein CcmE [Lichenihabitans sp.]